MYRQSLSLSALNIPESEREREREKDESHRRVDSYITWYKYCRALAFFNISRDAMLITLMGIHAM